MTDNTTELDFGTTAQKATDAEKLPVASGYSERFICGSSVK